mmetsp:Transcript_19851/g.38888  ORF Transcript_19851/g.38888 Transcript_19851/m.38888 type:complete len:160 (+) Transcript_19851:244-723(+)
MEGLPKEGGGVRLRILLGEPTVAVVSMWLCRLAAPCGVTGKTGGTTLTDVPIGYIVVVETVGITLTDAPAGIKLTEAPGDMLAEPPTDMEADAPSYTIHLPLGDPGRGLTRGGVTERGRCCCRCDCHQELLLLLPANMEALPPGSIEALPPASMEALPP